MTIETKYNLNSDVWLMRDNKVIAGSIWSVEPIVCTTHDRGSSTKIKYRLEEYGEWYDEKDLFQTKEALLHSL